MSKPKNSKSKLIFFLSAILISSGYLSQDFPFRHPYSLKLVTALAQEWLDDPEEIKLYVGEPKVLAVVNPKRIAIAKPEIADVRSVSTDEVVVEPKAFGATNLLIWDDYGQHSYQLKVFREDLSLVKEHIDSLIRELNLPEVLTKVNEAEGKILLIGEVAELNEKERLLTALDSIKDKILDLIQIKEEETTLDIDVQVLEMDKDASKTLGFTMPTSINVTEPAGKYPDALGKSLTAIFHVFEWPRSSFSAKIDALIEEGRARVLSSPRLACQSGKEAELLVGGEKPILTTTVAATTGAAGTNVEYKEFGIKLKIKPTVVEEQRIKVAVNIEVSEVGTVETLGSTATSLTSTTTITTARAYPLSKRTASTELFMDSGQTLGIGGLVKQKEETTVSKTAFLGDIPILGMLFRRKDTKIGGGKGERGNVELVILLTPSVVEHHSAFQRKASYKSPSSGFSRERASGAADKNQRSLGVGLDLYTEDLKRQIASSIAESGLAKEFNLKGTVKLRLRIKADGQLEEAYVIGSSGSELLDSAAIKTIKKLTPFPSFPFSIDKQEITIDIPIVYS